jgi:hypothetical protein
MFTRHRSRALSVLLFFLSCFALTPLVSARAQATAPEAAASATPQVDARITTPRAFLGFTPGDDYKLANYKRSYAYFHKIAGETGRMRLFEVGKTAMGEPMLLAVISSEENLQRLDQLKEVARTLADGRVPEAEARNLAREGRAMVWIDGGLHATEVGCAQHAINLGYDLVAREDDVYRRIRERCVVLLMPTLNPDGQNLVADWFNTHYGTPREGTPLPVLYQKYSGHDNNRDWFMLNLPETRNVTRLLYHDWFPQVVYNHHQAGNMFPERMFVPPYDEPLNPNVPPLVVRGINAVGTAMQTQLAEEGRTGVISLDTYTAWWNGGMRSTPFFHNVIGILTEVAHPSPYPATYAVPPALRNPTLWYHDPYKGGRWRFADTVGYMNAGSVGLLRWAADRADDIQLDRWRMARAAIEQGGKEAPFGFLVPFDAPAQRDPNTTALFLERMRLSGLEVRRAEKPVVYGGKTYPAGTAVLLAAQPNRPFLLDMFTPQNHPMLRRGPTGPPIPPYDIAGWTLAYQMGVETVPMASSPPPDLLAALGTPATAAITAPAPPALTKAPSGGAYLLPAERNASFTAANRLLAGGVAVERWTTARTVGGTQRAAAGTFVIPANEKAYRLLATVAADLRLPVTTISAADLRGVPRVQLRPARVATYDPYGGDMPQGWAQFVLETFEFPHRTVTNPELRAGNIYARLDTLILTTYPNVQKRTVGGSTRRPRADGADPTGGLGPGFLGGSAPKELAPEVKARLDGIGTAGEENLRRFVADGGTLVAFSDAAARVVELFRLPVREVTKGTAFYSPGSVFRIEVDPDNPLGWGLPRDVNVFFDKSGAAWESTLSFPAASDGGAFALYPDENPLLSGWIIEDQVIRRRAAGVLYRVGKGRVVAYGFGVTFRGQPHMGFPLLFNALYPMVPSAGTGR